MQRRLNSTQIENAGVDAVSDYFNFTDTLDPSIPKKDKEPVWDGKLFLYKNGSDKQSKTDLIGFIPVQVKGRQFKDFSNSKIKYLVSANDVKLYQNNGGVAFFVVYVNVDTSEKKIGKVEKTKVNVEFKSLSQRIRNFEFILALKDKPIINISDTQFKIEGINVSYEIERILDADRNLKTVLDILNVSEDLRIDNLSDREIKNINTLIDHYINGKCIKTDDEVDHQLVRIELGNLTLLFLAEKVNEPNFYKFHSIHDLNNFVFSTRNDLDQHILMPPFVAFNTETFRDVCNITYEDFMGQCEQMKSNDNRYYQAINWSILRMLNAYDQQETKKQVLIDVAKELNQWLIDNDPDKKSSLIHLINRLQITKRIQELSQQEKNLLYDYIDAPYPNDELRFACYTLLDDKQSASRYLSKFTEEKREFYKTLPIYNLYINLS